MTDPYTFAATYSGGPDALKIKLTDQADPMQNGIYKSLLSDWNTWHVAEDVDAVFQCSGTAACKGCNKPPKPKQKYWMDGTPVE